MYIIRSIHIPSGNKHTSYDRINIFKNQDGEPTLEENTK